MVHLSINDVFFKSGGGSLATGALRHHWVRLALDGGNEERNQCDGKNSNPQPTLGADTTSTFLGVATNLLVAWILHGGLFLG